MQPSTEHDWTIHALNIHGAFFERWAATAMVKQPDWRVRSTNYPVKIPPNPKVGGNESTIDIVAQRTTGDVLATLTVECKKNNPKLINWVFFRSLTPRQVRVPTLAFGMYDIDQPPGWYVVRRLVEASQIVVDDGRETRSDYLSYKDKKDKTRTANAAINDGAYQVALGLQALVWEELYRAGAYDEASRTEDLPERVWTAQTFLPVVLTTARLKVASFEPEKVNPLSGEIRFEDVVLSDVPYLIYDYALPRHLQAANMRIEHLLTEDSVNLWSRLQIAFVSSDAIGKFLASDLVAEVCGGAGSA
jgi:hypothetical protein